MSSLTEDPIIRFSHIFQLENDSDNSWLEMTTNSGNTWTKVGSAGTGTNWYNDTTNQYWEGNSGSWVSAENILSGAAGSPFVRLRYVMNSDNVNVQEGVGIDEVRIGYDSLDIAVISADSVLSSCTLNQERLYVSIEKSMGSDNVQNLNISYTLNDGVIHTDLVRRPFAGGEIYVHEFDDLLDLSTPGVYNISIFIAHPDDVNSEKRYIDF